MTIPSTSFPGSSLFLLERTLVAAGHVEMCVNKLRSRGRSSNKFCRLDDEIPPGVGRKFLLENALELLSCVQTASLSASYHSIILKEKQVTFLESLSLKKGLLALMLARYKNRARFAHAKPAFGKFAFSARAVHEKGKIMQ